MKIAASQSALEQVRAIALALPGVIEGSSYGTPGFKRGKKLFARLHQDGESLVVAMDPFERDLALSAWPKVLFLTPHYEAYPWVLVRLAQVERKQLRQLLTRAHAFVGPKTRGA